MAENRSDYALVVGINHYPDFRNLEGAIEDAKDFAKWLYQDSEGGNLPKDHCRVILSQPNPLRPPHEEIDEELGRIFGMLGNDNGRRFYLYFSGHGMSQDNIGANLCLARWSAKLWRNAALDSLDYLKTILGSGKFEEVVFLLDCCRVRPINAHGLPSALGFPRPDDEAGKSKRFIGYATEFQNSAYEAEVSDGVSEESRPLIRGHFTRALMKGLRGAAAVEPGGVPATFLKKYLEAETPRIAAVAKQSQKSEVDNGLPSNPDPVFGTFKPLNRIKVTIRFSEGRVGPIVLEGPTLDEIRRGMPDTGPWEQSLQKGWHALRDLGNGGEKTFSVGSLKEVNNVDF